MKFLGNRGRFLSIYTISLAIILPGDAQGSQNIIVSQNSHMAFWIFKLYNKSLSMVISFVLCFSLKRHL